MTRKDCVGRRLRRIVCIGFALASLSSSSQADDSVRVGDPLGTFRNTYYYLIFESEYPAEARTEPVKDLSGRILATVSKRFKKDLVMEGSGKLRDGRVVNWSDRIGGESRFEVTTHAWGRGVGDCPLVPLRTIAADPKQIPQGAIVRIEETVGMLLPDGTRHDGLWRAEDVGSAIQHDRVDIFVGKKKYAKYLTMAGIDHMEALTVSLVEPPPSDSCIYKSPKREP